MGKSAPSPPPAPETPDPRDTSAASTATNVSTAVANAYLGNITEISPYGKTEVKETGSKRVYDPYTGKTSTIPTFTRTTTYSPKQQAAIDAQMRAGSELSTLAADQAGFLKDYMSEPVNLDGLPQGGDAASLKTPEFITSIADDFSADRKRVEDAMFTRLDEQLGRDSETLRTRLANQGIKAGSEAYDREMQGFGRRTDDARIAAILSAGEEQSRLYNQALSGAQFANQAASQAFTADQARLSAADQDRATALQERMAMRNQPINEITALLSGSQVQQPQFMGANMPTIPTTDVAGIINQDFNNRLGIWNTEVNYALQQQQMQNSMTSGLLGGLFGLGAAGISAFSDRRVKKDIEKVGKAKGFNLYEYRFKGQPADTPKTIGVMAQEVEKKRPDAVTTGPDGIKRVKYGAIFGTGAA